VTATNAPLRVAGSDGVDHLEYDLIVTNAFPAPVTLTAVEVIAPGGDSLLRLTGDTLVQATQPLFFREAPPTATIPPSDTVGVVVDVVVPRGRAVDRLTHRIAYEVAPDAPGRSMLGSFAVDGPDLLVDPRPAVVLSPPLRGNGWVALGCCAAESGHRAIRLAVGGTHVGKPETFAVDWIQLRDGRFFAGDGADNEEWFAHGAAVYAAAAGTVVAVRDGMPEETPLQPVQNVKGPGDYGGNQVIVAIAPGVWAFYAHLQPGSLTVKEGDTVTAGQEIGKLGNAGNTTAPHLHFGLLDAPDPMVGNSLPMVFERWTLAGRIGPADLEVAMVEPGGAAMLLEGAPQEQSATLQLYLDVADFG
jgi:hypothetical protein